MTAATLEQAVDARTIAEVLNASLEKVYRMTRAKEIPSFKVGREYRYFPTQVLAKLQTPAPAWAQSNRSKGRRRVA
ncbi:helix-turn-helix domain-containing protein [Microbacterium binotii]|uniref:Helix-turn-helix domain-containing protein n=1 Tax=Microbacterium binotii TaxID=462710 RepID=A0ABN3PCL0_9MICO